MSEIKQLRFEIAQLKRKKRADNERSRLVHERNELRQSPAVARIKTFGRRLTGDVYNYMNRPQPKSKRRIAPPQNNNDFGFHLDKSLYGSSNSGFGVDRSLYGSSNSGFGVDRSLYGNANAFGTTGIREKIRRIKRRKVHKRISKHHARRQPIILRIG